LTEEASIVDLGAGSAGSVTLHHDPYPTAKEEQIRFAADVMVGIAIAFDLAGREDLAGRLTYLFLEPSGLVTLPEVVFELAGAMTRGRQIAESLDLCERLTGSERPEARAASFVFILPALLNGDSLSEGEKEHLRRVLLGRIERAETEGDALGAAGEHYSLANHLRSSREYRQALHHYRLAQKCDPTYRGRQYFWAEIGEILFGRMRYMDAANAYERAIELGADEWTLALHADALMFSGRYRDAEDAFRRWNSANADGEPEWRLKEFALGEMRARLGIDNQQRKPDEAEQCAGEVQNVADPREAKRMLEEALALDALSSLAWFNLGFALRQLGDEYGTWFAYLMAALTNPGDAESWLNVIVAGVDKPSLHGLVDDALLTAPRVSGDRLLMQLVDYANQQPQGFPREEFLSAFEGVLAELPKEKTRGLTVRLPGDDGTLEEVFLPPRPQ
jgi:tetratricopeptide (TPR) repeat protein